MQILYTVGGDGPKQLIRGVSDGKRKINCYEKEGTKEKELDKDRPALHLFLFGLFMKQKKRNNFT